MTAVMTSLRLCSSCRGFVPLVAPACPHCAAPAGAGLFDRVGRALFGLASGASLAVTLMACYGMPCSTDAECEPCDDPSTDLDEDGYCGEWDCDEENAAINAGAFDQVGDGVDQNCDGVDGEREPPTR
jgi:hypothetical protein